MGEEKQKFNGHFVLLYYRSYEIDHFFIFTLRLTPGSGMKTFKKWPCDLSTNPLYVGECSPCVMNSDTWSASGVILFEPRIILINWLLYCTVMYNCQVPIQWGRSFRFYILSCTIVKMTTWGWVNVCILRNLYVNVCSRRNMRKCLHP